MGDYSGFGKQRMGQAAVDVVCAIEEACGRLLLLNSDDRDMVIIQSVVSCIRCRVAAKNFLHLTNFKIRANFM